MNKGLQNNRDQHLNKNNRHRGLKELILLNSNRKRKKRKNKKKQQEDRRREEQQLLQAFDKATEIISQKFQQMVNELGKTKKIAYTISKQRRIEKSRAQKRQNYTSGKRTSSGITHPRKPSKPKKPRTGRKY